ncbi:MAG: lipopolysaccharide transport periplasmic protein LptA [Mariprofundaceae bacterium]|nr:lipopolysaccharide transport periplasmic protein LptA [Mariprofundaceae bacterium]
MKILLTLWLCLIANIAWADNAVTIESEQMIVDHLHSQVEFKGGVHLVRGNFDLRCDRLLAYYQNNELQRAKAFGRVRMQQGDKRGASKQATYNKKDNILILIGQASIEDSDGVIRGEKIIHNIKTDHTQVIQGKGERVRMRIESEDSLEKKP